MNNPYLVQINQIKLTSVQKSLQKFLLCLLKQQDLQEISVRSLCEKAQVARSSFYAHYDNTDELLIEIENQLVSRISDLDHDIIDSDRKEADDFTYFSEIIDFIEQKSDELTTLLIRNYNHRLVKKWKKAIKSHLWVRLRLDKTTPKQELIFEMLASEVISAFIFYLKEPNSVKKEDIYEIVAERLKELSKIKHFS